MPFSKTLTYQYCEVHANRLAMNTGYIISWGELTTLAINDFSQLLSSCTYDGDACTINDFKPIDTIVGRCITFNGQNTRKARGTGIHRGLRLQFLSDPKDSREGFSVFRDYGYRVIVHNSDEPPRPESEGIVLALNSTAYIGMRQIKSVDETVFSSCTLCRSSNNIITERVLSFPQYSIYYSYSFCQGECFFKYVIDQCGCAERLLYTIISDKYRLFRNCTAPDICCEVEAFNNVNETCDCPPRCSTVDYSLTVSRSTNQWENQVGVNIYYESLILERRRTTDSYTLWSFISDIGGNTGLFLGLTLLS